MTEAPPTEANVTFRATILRGGKTATIAGYTYRSTVAPMRGSFTAYHETNR